MEHGAQQSKQISIISHILTIWERLEKMKDIVRVNLEEAQRLQKKAYDRRTRECSFKEGNRVLVLLPTSTHKLIAQWQGPFNVLRRVGKVTYEVYMSNRRKRRNIYHINLLCKWYDREAGETIGFAEEDDECLS